MTQDIKVNAEAAWLKVRELINRAERSRGGIGQAALAHRAGVSQAAISRIRGEQPIRIGRSFIRLYEYALKADHLKPPKDPLANLLLVDALQEVWTGSDEHAAALAAIIRASADVARAMNQ